MGTAATLSQSCTAYLAPSHRAASSAQSRPAQPALCRPYDGKLQDQTRCWSSRPSPALSSSLWTTFQRSGADEGFASLHRQWGSRGRVHMAASGAVVATTSVGVARVQGSGRVQMEDTHYVGNEGDIFSAGVFDGHGGNAVALFLEKNFWPAYKSALKGKFGEKFALIRATKKTYLQIDDELTAPPKGLFGGMRERGLGGSKCGATGATVAIGPNADLKRALQNVDRVKREGERVLVAANVGDSRVLLVRNGEPVQLTVDHTPDREDERIRIELKNPNSGKKPMVVNVGGTWRVGGLLALSRAFGDVYLKDYTNKDGGQGGFGLIAEPDVVVESVTEEDELVVLATDGIFEVLSNEEVVELINAAGPDASLQKVAQDLVALAQEKGTKDDVTVVLAKL